MQMLFLKWLEEGKTSGHTLIASGDLSFSVTSPPHPLLNHFLKTFQTWVRLIKKLKFDVHASVQVIENHECSSIITLFIIF